MSTTAFTALDVQPGRAAFRHPAAESTSTSRALKTSDQEVVPISALPYIITPERRALLNTIRFAEGTWLNGDDLGYKVMFGGSLMPSLERHPDRVMRTPGYASAAAGAYQFMPFTWNMVQRKLGFRRFGPIEQDQGALFLVQRRKALGLADRGQMSPTLAAKLAPEWASFPTLSGHSFYGQPVKRFADLRRFYNYSLTEVRERVERERDRLAQQSDNQTAGGPQQPVCTGPTVLCF
ncbi:endolysin [Synechococcus sp. RSCCF101]|nr:endolysin [Synechococcus sp. RSCCF101]